MLLELKDIHCRYGNFTAIRGVSLQIPKGAIISFLGANGCGKSTILKTISGLVKPAKGQVLFEGERIDGLKPPKVVKRGIAHVPEGRRLFPFMTVRENLMAGAFTRNDKEETQRDLEALMERFPILANRRDKLASQLSGGEQAQVAIGRGLMARPKLLMLDEPLQGLAPLVIGDVEEMILELNRGGLTVIMVEHNVHMALGMAHQVYLLETGQVIMHGDPSQISESNYVQQAYLGA